MQTNISPVKQLGRESSLALAGGGHPGHLAVLPGAQGQIPNSPELRRQGHRPACWWALSRAGVNSSLRLPGQQTAGRAAVFSSLSLRKTPQGTFLSFVVYVFNLMKTGTGVTSSLTGML